MRLFFLIFCTIISLDGCLLDGCFWPWSLQNSLRRDWMLMHFFLAIASCHQHSTLASQTCEGLRQVWALPRHLASFFFECLGIQFFNSLTCDLQDTMPHQRSPTLIPREAEDFPRGDNHSKHVPLPTYLGWLQPIYYNSRFVFIHVKTTKILLVVKTLIKKHRAAATLISSHESKN